MSDQAQHYETTGNRSHCPPVDLTWMLALENKRKAMRRGSFISTDDVPKRSVVEDNRIVDYLRSQGFTIGLARTLIKNTDDFPARIWLVDNSASMNSADGHRVVQNTDHKVSNICCTRWEEVTATLMWHASFSIKMEAPTAVRLIQAPSMGFPQQVGIASAVNVEESADLSRLAQMLHQQPAGGGGGPLPHLLEIVHTCLKSSTRLLGRHKSLAILYVTDRLPVDEDGREGEHATTRFLETLNLLQGSSVFVVIRLSTDDQRVVDFYNDLDRRMDAVTKQPKLYGEDCISGHNLHLDVLDDFVSEAAAVHEHNPWLNYAYPLHLCRESAVQFPVFDALNDRPLQMDELVEFLTLLFDRNQYAWALQPLPNPQTQYADFRAEVLDMNRKAGSVYDPIKRRSALWIDIHQLDRIYGGQVTSACTSCVIT